MKKLFWLGLLLPGVIFGVETLQKKAVLFLPEQIECRSGEGASLSAEVGLRWDEEELLHLDIWSKSRPGKLDEVFGDITVLDEEGRELRHVIYVTMPLAPDKQTLLKKGEFKRFGLYEMYSAVIFPRPGNYCAIARVSSAFSGSKPVEFVTSRRWFKVIEAPPKDNRL